MSQIRFCDTVVVGLLDASVPCRARKTMSQIHFCDALKSPCHSCMYFRDSVARMSVLLFRSTVSTIKWNHIVNIVCALTRGVCVAVSTHSAHYKIESKPYRSKNVGIKLTAEIQSSLGMYVL